MKAGYELNNAGGDGATTECPSAADCSLMEEIRRLREECRRLEELCFIDELTGLYNFRYMQKAMEVEMERTRRTRLPTGLIVADLDYFKNVNTLYGHECGNAALSLVGRVLKESVRIIDVPCRYGGEEFAIILPGASLREAVRIAERLGDNIRYSPVVFENESVTITASFGVAIFQSSDEATVEGFLKKTDMLLYEAKNLGRNRVCAEQLESLVPQDEVTAEEKKALTSSDGGNGE